jgi:hypothetical protein
MNALGWWGFKDVRVSWVFCDLVGALCLFLLAARVNPGSGQTRFRQLITLTFLFMPRSLFVLEQSFTEPLTVASLGVFAVLLARPTHPVLCGIIMGLLFSTKQYVVLAAPLIFKLRQRLLMWLVAALAAVALFLPFILWNWDAMYDDLIGFFLKSKGRSDALSICGAMKRIAHAAWGINYEIPWMVVAPLWVGGLVFFTWKMKRSFAGMLFSTASLWLFFFIFGKQAFMNYWYLILFALLLAVAAVPRGAPPSDRVSREEST